MNLLEPTNHPDRIKRARALAALKQKILYRDFPSFIAQAFATVDPGARFLPNWHIELIAEYLEAARRGEVTRLIINLPPRSLKSVCVSVAWPAWLLGHNPASRVLVASYAAPLALKHSLDCRMLMHAPWYRALFPATRMAADQNEKHKFMTTARGYRIATSVGGTLTGEGGNFLIMDDPINPEQAASRHVREHVNRWFDHTFATRLDDKAKGAMVLVMQRLHAEDLSGYLLAKGGWEHLCLPAMAEEAKVYDFGRVHKVRAKGEPLHAARENAALIERARRELGSMAFAAQYQQNPLPEKGGMVQPWWLARYDVVPENHERVVQSWDTAIKSGAANDASVCLTFVEMQGRTFLLDAVSMRVEYPDLKRAVLAQAERWQPEAVLVEDKASGQQLLQDLRRESALALIATLPKGDKVTRFAAVSAIIEAGRLVLPRQAHWLAEFEAEILRFPAAPHDDYVDALTQYLEWMRRRGGLNPNLRRF